MVEAKAGEVYAIPDQHCESCGVRLTIPALCSECGEDWVPPETGNKKGAAGGHNFDEEYESEESW